MLRIVLAPDSFKGSLAAPQVCTALGTGFARVWPDVDIRARPMADGGEGTLDAVLTAVGTAGHRRRLSVCGASGSPTDAAYGMLEPSGNPTAVLEAAQVVGITDVQG